MHAITTADFKHIFTFILVKHIVLTVKQQNVSTCRSAVISRSKNLFTYMLLKLQMVFLQKAESLPAIFLICCHFFDVLLIACSVSYRCFELKIILNHFSIKFFLQ